jgi:glycosyltransferase involved in cell wall biosynthesis
VIVIDNNPARRTPQIVEDARNEATSAVTYQAEPRPGIPFARNTCVQAALARDADALVFIDDDEWPVPGWFEALMTTWQRTDADIVLGPAKGVLPADAPRWARRSGVFDKDRRLADGAPIRTAYSYNTLLSRRALETLGPSFDPAFRYTGSSDHHYFKQAGPAGLHSVWSANALVYEEVGSHRVRLSWVVKRGYRIGAGATRSTRLRLHGLRGAGRITLLAAFNLLYAAGHVVGTAHPRLSWVEGLRRLGIAAGLIGGTVHRYEEYRCDG